MKRFLLLVLFFSNALPCLAMDSDTDTPTSSEISNNSGDEEQATEMRWQAVEMQNRYLRAAQRRKQCAVYLISSLLIAGAAADIATTWLAPTTGRVAVNWNAPALDGCTYVDAFDCNRVINPGICEQICTLNQENATTRMGPNPNFLEKRVENCYLLQNCPENAQARLIAGILALAARVLTCSLPAWLWCMD